jgi:hypothetical protein
MLPKEAVINIETRHDDWNFDMSNVPSPFSMIEGEGMRLAVLLCLKGRRKPGPLVVVGSSSSDMGHRPSDEEEAVHGRQPYDTTLRHYALYSIASCLYFSACSTIKLEIWLLLPFLHSSI